MSYARKKKAARRASGVKQTARKVRKSGNAGKTARKKKGGGPSRRTIHSREGGVRLNKYLADLGVASRRAADELIGEGHVWVDGVQVEELGLRIDPDEQRIEIDGEPLLPSKRDRKRYYLLNKPAGVVCTNERRETRPRAIDLITDRDKGRIYTVGRLDEESKGLILLTNDGDFANRIMHPRYGVAKTYMVKLRGRISDEAVQKVREGVHISGGRTESSRVLIRKRTREFSYLQVILQEGRNREIRRVFHSVGFEVVELRRSRIGTLTDKGLRFGFWRPLSAAEVAELNALAAGEEVRGAVKGPVRRGAGKKSTRRRAAPAGGTVQGGRKKATRRPTERGGR